MCSRFLCSPLSDERVEVKVGDLMPTSDMPITIPLRPECPSDQHEEGALPSSRSTKGSRQCWKTEKLRPGSLFHASSAGRAGSLGKPCSV